MDNNTDEKDINKDKTDDGEDPNENKSANENKSSNLNEDTFQESGEEGTGKTGDSSEGVFNSKKSFFYGILAVVVIIILAGIGYVYYAVNNMSENPTVVKAAEILKIPAAKVNGEKVLYSDYVNQKQTLENFYNSQPKNLRTNFNEEQIQQQVISRLIANKVLAQTAENRGIEVTQEDISSMKDRIKQNIPENKNLNQIIQDRYGWTMDEYVENVIKPNVLRSKVQEDYMSEVGKDESVKKEAQNVLQKAKDGEDFEELAKNYGSQTTRKRAGDLGWFGKGVMVPKFEQVAFNLKPGQISQDLVETKFGYHIIKVEDRRTTTTDKGEEKEQVKAKHILFQNQSSDKFRQFMDNKLKQAKIEIMIPVKNPFKQGNQPGLNREQRGQQGQSRSQKQMNKEEIKKKLRKKIQQQRQQNNGTSNQQGQTQQNVTQ